MKNMIKGISAILLYFILYYGIGTIIAILPINFSNWSMDAKYIFNIVYELIIVFIMILIFKETIKNDFKNYLKNIKIYMSEYIKYWFIALGLMFASNFIIIIIKGDIAQNEQSIRELFNVSPIFTFLLASIIAPVLEEIVFRLSIYKIIGKYKYLFIIVSGLIFGSMHVINDFTTLSDLLYIIPYSIPGIIFAYTLVKSNNIFVPISLHLIHNTFALTLQMITSMLYIK